MGGVFMGTSLYDDRRCHQADTTRARRSLAGARRGHNRNDGKHSGQSPWFILGGFQQWTPAIVCWAMGGYGLGLTGVLKTNTKQDMAAHSRTIVLWGSTLASQPDLAPHLVEARKHGAYVIHIDTRRTEASRHADEVLLVPPGSDAALALALVHVMVQEQLYDQAFIDNYTLGFAPFVTHVQQYSPEWASTITGIEPERIRALAQRYATQTPAMIVLGGSSMFKHQHGWEPGRAIYCLPALTGQLGIAGGGLGQRHGASSESTGYVDVLADVTKNMPGEVAIPSHMATMTEALTSSQLDVLLLLGTNMLSSFADANTLARVLAQIRLAACQVRKSACWTSGPYVRSCERPCVCRTSPAWLSSHLA